MAMTVVFAKNPVKSNVPILNVPKSVEKFVESASNHVTTIVIVQIHNVIKSVMKFVTDYLVRSLVKKY